MMKTQSSSAPKKSLMTRASIELKKNWQLYLMVLPALVFLILFKYWPMLGIQIAFKDFSPTKGIWDSPLAKSHGEVDIFKHFSRFLRSKYSLQIIMNTVTLSLYALLAKFPCCIILALLMNEMTNLGYKKVVQFVTYAPHFISTIVIVGIMQQIFAYPSALMKTGGVINSVILSMGGEAIHFMESPAAFKHMYVWSGVWSGVGWGSIIYMATLGGVDPQQYEAATLDGASKLQKMWYVTIPYLIPTAVTMFILDVGHLMNLGFEKAYAMQNNLNRESSQILATYVYTQGLGDGNYSFSTAVNLFNSLINLVMVFSVNAISKKVTETSLW